MFSLPIRTNNSNKTSGDSESSQHMVISKTNLNIDSRYFGVIIEKPAYPTYTSLDSRVRSFSSWTKRGPPSVDELAKAGFAYTGVGDSVRCYFCTLGVRDWQPEDCPWTQHALQSPSCGHIRRCKGNGFITHLQNRRRHSLDVDGTYEECEDTPVLNLDSLNNWSKVWKLNSVAIRAVTDFVPDEKTVKTGVNMLMSRGIETFSGTELMKAIEEIENGGSNSTNFDQSQKEKLTNENTELRQPVLCKICMDAVASVVTLPCGHMFSCPQCIAPLSKCAICRIKIEGTVRATLCTFDREIVE